MDDSQRYGWKKHTRLFGCELEAVRAKKMASAISHMDWSHERNGIAHGDAFLLLNDKEASVHILWLNPPYDTDREHGRLEERWLLRFAPLVAPGGALLFYVPFYALAASADTIARHFEMPRCFRMPGKHFDAFQQVVLVARRRCSLAIPDPAVAVAVRRWAASAAASEELPLEGLREPVLTVSTGVDVTPPRWEMGAVDLSALLAAYAPWSTSDRAGRVVSIPGIRPEDPYTEIMAPVVRVAVDPRPSHIALAAGAGVLSGARLRPDDGKAGPDLLLKGVHRRVFRHLRWKENTKCERVAEERQHAPELQLSVLDLSAGRYHKLRASMDPSDSAAPSDWTVGDLLERYGQGMLGALRDRCRILCERDNPEHRAAYPIFPISPDPLLNGQEYAVRATLRLLDEPDRSAVLLGEIGVGKTRIALTAAAHRLKGRGRILVLCPPLLLPEWESEVAKVLPSARVVVLDSVETVDHEARTEPEGIVVALLSKETAKLGSAYVGAQTCGRCGHRTEEPRDKIAAKRLRCGGTTFRPANHAARVALFMAERLATELPGDAQLQDVARMRGGRVLARAVERALRGSTARKPDWRSREDVVRTVVPALRRMVQWTRGDAKDIVYAWWSCIHALADESLIVREARCLFAASLADRAEYGAGNTLRGLAAQTLLLLPPWSPWFATVAAEFGLYEGRDYQGAPRKLCCTDNIRTANLDRRAGKKPGEWDLSVFTANTLGEPEYGGRAWGSDAALTYGIERICALAAWHESDECGEPLYQCVPLPRRVPIAQYILKRQPGMFDFMVIDELHQYAHGSSAQSKAAQQLLSLRMRRGVPVIGLTGSVMNGYARSLFVALWHLSGAFRREFSYNQAGEFERRFGFLVEVEEYRDKESGSRVVFGTHSDRVVSSTRTTGAAPGILPTAVLKYLLPIGVTVQLADLEADLPPCREEIVYVAPREDQHRQAKWLEDKLLRAIAEGRFKEGLAGKLFGPLGHLPRYLDHATSDTGNWHDGSWTIAYPEDLELPAGVARVVASAPGFDPAQPLPKEDAVVSHLAEAISAGRNVVIATTRTALAQRLLKVARRVAGPKVALLEARKVPAAKRRAWIDGVKAAGTRVLVTNPAALPVGLNNLVGYFTDVFVYDDPNNDPTLLRQFRGRFVRIGQSAPVRLLMFLYEGSLQADAHDLLQKKRVIAEATDGLDASAAFEVAGVGDAVAFETDLGKALYARMRMAA